METHKQSILVVVALAGLMFQSNTVLAEDSTKAKGHDPMTMQLQGKTGAELEKAYLRMMIQHHEDGVKMAELAPGKAKRAEVKELASKIVSDQKEEIAKMTAWLKDWYQASPDPSVVPAEASKMMQEHMAMLESAQGDEFDKHFLKLMSMHHQGAVSMSKLIEEKAEKAEVKQFAKKIDGDQSKQIEKMKDWQSKWFKG